MLLLAPTASGLNHGHQRAAVRPPPLVLSALPSLSEAAIPASFDWRNVNGRSLVTADVNQHIPTYCGSCWIHGTIAALNDRIKVARDGQFPDIMLSRQAAMNCVHALDDPEKKKLPSGCQGGAPDELVVAADYLLWSQVMMASGVCRTTSPSRAAPWT